MPPLHRGAVLTLAGALVIGLLAPAASPDADDAVRLAATALAPVTERVPGQARAAAAPAAVPRGLPEQRTAALPVPALRAGMAELAGPARMALRAGTRANLAPVASRAPRCNTEQRPAKRASYQGRSASKVYDRIFRPGPRMPHLAGHVPQGLATWRNWNGSGATLLLLGMYRDGAPSYLVGINPSTGRHVGTVRTKATHFGALGVSRGWLITQDNVSPRSTPTVRRYKLSTVRKQMKVAARTGTKPYLGQSGKSQRVAGASFMAVDGGSMWIGRFRSKPSTMHRYVVGRSGRLTAVEGPVRVPARTQGLLATRKNFVFATSGGDGRGKMTVVRRSAPAKSIGCVWTPSMPQNMTTVGGRLYAAYESGAARFDKAAPANRIRELHTGSVRSLDAIAR